MDQRPASYRNDAGQPHKGSFVSYLRVSTDRQGRSGLGLEAQRAAVDAYLNGGSWRLLEEYLEVESGKKNDRPQLAKALHHAKVTGATLVIAKLDRLSRDAHFLLGLDKAGVDFVAADMPHANRLTVGIMALVAEQEREAISKRTKEALAAAKRRGVKLGNPNGAAALRKAGKGNAAAVARVQEAAHQRAEDLQPVIQELQEHGITGLRAIGRALNERGVVTPRGGKWHPTSVVRVMERMGARD
jgi:DNA invertase Pin-like site-specific DNA recombinase